MGEKRSSQTPTQSLGIRRTSIQFTPGETKVSKTPDKQPDQADQARQSSSHSGGHIEIGKIGTPISEHSWHPVARIAGSHQPPIGEKMDELVNQVGPVPPVPAGQSAKF